MPILIIVFFSSWESFLKIENIQTRCLGLNFLTTKALINKKRTCTMEIKRLRVSATEIFKTRNDINPSYVKNIFISKAITKFCQNDIEVSYHKTTSYGDESLNILGLEILNHRPWNMQPKTCLIKFEEYINTWLGCKYKFSL